MYGLRLTRALAPGFFALVSGGSGESLAQQRPEELPAIVVTATRGALDSARVGSAISIIEGMDIERRGGKGLADVLRAVPGLDIHESGGIGSVSNATLRGSNPGQTLILIDGNRVGDPTGTDGSLDLGALGVTDIERIEVLRGPQSALYGSDAMGGVINIITRKGVEGIRRSASVEAGSYGTLHSRGSVSGAADRLTYAFSIDALHSDGFARYVDRAQVRAGTWPRVPKSDPTDRVGVSGRVSYAISDTVTVEAGLTAHFNRISFDNPFAFVPANIYDRYNQSKQWTGSAFAGITADAFDGRLKNKLTVFASSVDRAVAYTESCPDFASNCVTRYRGARTGAEYQGDLKLGRHGLLIFGARTETDSSATSLDYPIGYAGPLTPNASARQTANSVFALYQFTLGGRLDISLGGRVDAVAGGHAFPTWRATVAYRIPESGTKLRASAGTGAKSPSLFQRFSDFGNLRLNPERSIGFDAGADQSLFEGRVTLSSTLFYNKYRDLIDFNVNPACAPEQFFGCYYNVNRAVTYGAELAADAILAPDAWRARASFTHLVAKDELLNTKLLQRPRNKGVFSIIYSGFPNLEMEARATFVGSKLDFGFPLPVKIAPYAKFDVFANYKINDTLSVFARAENIAGARYEEIVNYRTAGRSIYAGLKAVW